MTRNSRCGWILLGLLAFATTTGRADDPPAPQTDGPVINPGPAAATPPQIEAPPEVWVPDMHPPVFDPQYRDYTYSPGRFNFGYGYRALGKYNMFEGYSYGEPGFNFGYGYRPLGYTFWPRYGDYTYFGRFLDDPDRFYNRPYMWHPFWSYQRYRQYPVW